jgi:hypothetical protein
MRHNLFSFVVTLLVFEATPLRHVVKRLLIRCRGMRNYLPPWSLNYLCLRL